MYEDPKSITPAESSISLRLAEIRRRCSQLLSEPDALELTLEDAAERPDGTNPYNRG